MDLRIDIARSRDLYPDGIKPADGNSTIEDGHSADVSQLKNETALENGSSRPEDNHGIDGGSDDDRDHVKYGYDGQAPYFYDDGEEDQEIDINDIVEHDETTVHQFVSRDLIGQLIDSTHYKVFAAVIVLFDVILIAVGTNKQLSVQSRHLLNVLDQAVLSMFVCEILLKWFHSFPLFWRDGWNILDFTITFSLLFSSKFPFLRSLRTNRILRTVRAFRCVTSVSLVGRLSTVVQAIWRSIPAVANIGILLIMFLLVSSVIAVIAFGAYADGSFGNLEKAFFSMFICITQDGWVTIYKEMKHQLSDSPILFGLAHIFLVVVIVFGAIVFANLLVAVVATSLSQAVKEKDTRGRPQGAALQRKLNKKDDLAFGTSDNIPLISFTDVRKHADLSSQLPLQLTDLRHLDVNILTKYFMILAALEDNLNEYVSIQKDLKEMFEMVRDLNVELKEKTLQQ